MRESVVRTAFVTAAMAAAAVASGALAVQSVAAARYHSATARGVLLDYAALGAEQAAGRLQGWFGPRCYGILWSAGNTHPGSLGAVAKSISADARPVFDSARVIVQLDSTGRVTSTVTGAPDAAESAVINGAVAGSAAALPRSAYQGMTWIGPRGARELLIFTPPRSGRPGSAAFTLPRDAVARLLSPELLRGPLLPASLTHDKPVTRGLGIRLVGDSGRILVDSGFNPNTPFRVAHRLPASFADLTVEVSLDEALAPSLIIGGLPADRTPILLAVALSTILLLVAAAYQLRQERALARMQDDFVASVSHELRTPLAQIRMFAETLRLGRVRSPEESHDYLAIIEKESRRLTHLVDNLLHFARADRNRLAIAPTVLDTADLTRQIVAEFAPLAAARQATLRCEADGEATAEVDDAAFRQVMLNLLDNAVRYGPAGQVVTVRVKSDPDSVHVEVEDEGPGIPVSMRRHIWKRFGRGALARDPSVTGTGLGLAIVRDLVELHGGGARIESGGRGSARFIVTFPRRANR